MQDHKYTALHLTITKYRQWNLLPKLIPVPTKLEAHNHVEMSLYAYFPSLELRDSILFQHDIANAGVDKLELSRKSPDLNPSYFTVDQNNL